MATCLANTPLPWTDNPPAERRARGVWGIAILCAACTPASPRVTARADNVVDAAPAQLAPPEAAPAEVQSAEPALDASAPETGPKRLDPDGDDDPVDTGTGELFQHGHFERVGRSPYSLWRICDLTPFGDALYSAHAYQPLGADGAIVIRYQPDDEKKPFKVAFDWNRQGEPTTGGGAGQGFLRVHSIGGRLFVPDADPPYNGLGISEPGTEGYVFVSDPQGGFAPARAPGHRPPGVPDPQGRAGAAVLPRAYHVLDAIRYRGRLYASTGSVPPKQRAWYGPSPGALHVATEDWSRWNYEIDYPFPWQDGVWRLTFMVRFRDRLYAGIQDYDGREPNDYVFFNPPEGAAAIAREHVHPARVTPSGTAQTIRWYADSGKLYWIAANGDGVRLRVTEDGDRWTDIDLPDNAGRPTDIVRFRGALVVLTEWALCRLEGAAATVIARVTDKKTPFVFNDIFCAAPLAAYRNELYAGAQRDGALYKIVE